MKKGYWVVAYKSISDKSAVKAYAALAVPAVQSLGGRFLTMSTSQVHACESGLRLRTIIVEFESYDIALAAHESDDYQKALQALVLAQTATTGSLKVRNYRTSWRIGDEFLRRQFRLPRPSNQLELYYAA